MKKFFRNPFVLAFIIGAISLHVVKWFAEQRISAPPPMLSIGEWSLQDQKAKVFGSQDLAGKVVVASLFFTSCPSICPTLTRAMKQVQQVVADLDDKVQFISISVDPERDTSAVLSSFIAENGIDIVNWSFLTGDKKLVYELVVDKMKLHIGEKTEVEGDPGKHVYDIGHLAELLLIDQNGDLRGLFPTAPESLAALERALRLLVKKGAAA